MILHKAGCMLVGRRIITKAETRRCDMTVMTCTCSRQSTFFMPFLRYLLISAYQYHIENRREFLMAVSSFDSYIVDYGPGIDRLFNY